MLAGERRFLVEICAALGAVALLLTSMTSHAAAIPDIAAASLLNDFIHLTAASIWIGGVFGVAFTIMARPGREALLALLGRFSPVAAFSVVALGLTGIYSAWAQVYIPQAMATPYGITLAVKTLLVVVLLALGFGNLTWSRRGRRGDERAPRWIARFVTAEIAVMLLVMLSVGFLTTLEPARQTAGPPGRRRRGRANLRRHLRGRPANPVRRTRSGRPQHAYPVPPRPLRRTHNQRHRRPRAPLIPRRRPRRTRAIRHPQRRRRVHPRRPAHRHSRSLAGRDSRNPPRRLRRPNRVQIRDERRGRSRLPCPLPRDRLRPARNHIRRPRTHLPGRVRPRSVDSEPAKASPLCPSAWSASSAPLR